MSEFAPDLNDVIDILEHFDRKEEEEGSFLNQISVPPRRFHFTLALTLGIALVTLALSALTKLVVPNPFTLFVSHPISLEALLAQFTTLYSPQIPWVIFLSALLGFRYGTGILAIYVGLGLVGIPWFANGGGWLTFKEPSLGYLLGYLAIPFITDKCLLKGFASTKGWLQGRSLFILLAALSSVAVIHLAGLFIILLHSIVGHINLGEAWQWFVHYSHPTWMIDLTLALAGLMLVRWCRCILWVVLY